MDREICPMLNLKVQKQDGVQHKAKTEMLQKIIKHTVMHNCIGPDWTLSLQCTSTIILYQVLRLYCLLYKFGQ